MFAGNLREADVIRHVLDGLGFDISRIAFERSRAIPMKAVFSRPLANPELGETWLLITSAAHMPRSSAFSAALAGRSWRIRWITGAPAN